MNHDLQINPLNFCKNSYNSHIELRNIEKAYNFESKKFSPENNDDDDDFYTINIDLSIENIKCSHLIVNFPNYINSSQDFWQPPEII